MLSFGLNVISPTDGGVRLPRLAHFCQIAWQIIFSQPSFPRKAVEKQSPLALPKPHRGRFADSYHFGSVFKYKCPALDRRDLKARFFLNPVLSGKCHIKQIIRDLRLPCRFLRGQLQLRHAASIIHCMSEAETWAEAQMVAEVLMREPLQQPVPQEEPPVLIQRVTGNVFLCGGVVEHFSRETPTWAPQSAEEEKLRPLNVLYGCYDDANRSIEIFVNRIQRDAHEFNCNPCELIKIIRIHEYAHAIVHLGVRANESHIWLRKWADKLKTDWGIFHEARNTSFLMLPDNTHEFLAQAITYAALQRLPSSTNGPSLLSIFDALEAKQPEHYKLDLNVKKATATAHWPLVLEVARGESGFSLELGPEDSGVPVREKISALVCKSASMLAGSPQHSQPAEN